MTRIAGLALGQLLFAVDGLCQDPCAGGFTYSTWTAKQKGMCKLMIADGIFKGGCNVLLPHHRIERLGPVLSR